MTCGNYRGVKLLDQGLKVVERIVEVFCSHVLVLTACSLASCLTIFIMRQLHEKYLLGKGKDLYYFMLIDLKKACDRVPRKVLC